MRRFIQFLTGFFVGGILSSALVILFAPVSGTDVRERLSSYVTNLRDEIKTAAQERRAELEAELNALRSGKEIEYK